MMIFGLAAIGFLGLIFALWRWMRHHAVDLEKRMQTSFQSLSYEVMERSSRSFLDLAKTAFEKAQEGAKADLELKQKTIEALVTPLRETMKSLDEHQRELEKRREGAYASLFKQIEGMIQVEGDLRKETAQLSSALRSPSVRGAWGQVHLRRVVELAGLLNQCDFTEQTSHETDGRLLRPDLIVRLPGNRHIIIDAKTPLNAFLEAQDAVDEPQRVRQLELHATHLRKHMRDLSQKDYWKRFDLSPEFVVLFLPAESFFSAALQIDPTLIETGAERNVIVATPTTLIAILRSVAHSWKQEAISKNAEEIALLGQELYERLSTLSEHWSKVGRSLSMAVDGYNQSVASLESRVLVPARKLKDHGAAPMNKELAVIEPIDKLIRK
ncbi:MAG: RmuC-domain protein [Parachlamydiales bacterium]|nr:RmuC-domain protein [Parachlamydiales bacterium]